MKVNESPMKTAKEVRELSALGKEYKTEKKYKDEAIKWVDEVVAPVVESRASTGFTEFEVKELWYKNRYKHVRRYLQDLGYLVDSHTSLGQKDYATIIIS